jgi:alpha-tubulin suppressor-like RCC1 family protein
MLWFFSSLVAVRAFGGSPQTITFAAIPEKLTTDVAFVPSASASSGLPVDVSLVSLSGVATLSSGTVTLTGTPGSVTVKATQAGNATFDPAPAVYRTFVVRQGGFSIIAQGSTATHRLAIKSDGTLWAWGNNSFGQIGNGGSAEVFSPAQITTSANWTAVAVGGTSSAGIRGGTLWTWGRNSNGQLGLGNLTSRNTPVQVGSDTTWTHVTAGNAFMVARKSDGTLWAWGSNASSQLGLGDTSSRSTPTQIGFATTWSAIAAGSDHVIALQSSGGNNTLWAWGLNSSSQLGDTTTTNRNVPVQIGSATTWSKVACGNTSSYAITAGTALWAWGANSSGQLGLGDTTTRSSPTPSTTLTTCVEVCGGNISAIVLKTDGSIWSMGGTGNVGATATPTSGSTPGRIGTDNNWLSVAAGTSCCYALKTNGTIWSAGSNENGKLGYPMGNLRPFASGGVKALTQGLNSTHFIKNDGTMWALGRLTVGIAGDGFSGTRTMPTQVGTATNWNDIAIGNSHTLATKTDGTLWATGAGVSGQIGDGEAENRTSFVQVGSASYKSFGAGGSHSLAVRNDGTLWAWGNNTSGQLGDGTTTQRNSPVQIGTDTDWSVAACGSSSSYAIKSNGTLWSWGSNSSGQLGNGTTASHSSPAQVGTATNWAKVTGGLAFARGIQTDGTLWGWGSNSFGHLGDGTFTDRTSPVQSGTGVGWLSVQATSQHTVALRNDGTAWVCGSNASAQLGTGDSASRNTLVPLGANNLWSLISVGRGTHTVAATADGTLWGTGNNADYQMSVLQRVWFVLEPVHAPIATQSVNFPPVTITGYNTPIALDASATSGLPVTYFLTGPASISGDQITVTGPGEIKLLAYQGGDRPAWHDTAAVQAVVNAVPYVVSGLVTSISGTGAVLNASVGAAGQLTHCVFEYDTNIADGSYAFSVPGTPDGLTGHAVTPVSASLNALQGATQYFFKFTATNPAGTNSFTGSFTTLHNTFQQWASAQGLTGDDATLTADVDGDGMVNLLEWAYGTNPSVADPMLISCALAGGSIEFFYSRSIGALNAGVMFTVEYGDNLAALNWETTSVSESVISDNGTTQRVKAIIPADVATRRFVRLKVTEP